MRWRCIATFPLEAELNLRRCLPPNLAMNICNFIQNTIYFFREFPFFRLDKKLVDMAVLTIK